MVMWFGEQLEHKLVAQAGDFVYIPNGMPHLVLNASDREPAVAVLARTDPNEQEDVTTLPELDADLQRWPPLRPPITPGRLCVCAGRALPAREKPERSARVMRVANPDRLAMSLIA